MPDSKARQPPSQGAEPADKSDGANASSVPASPIGVNRHVADSMQNPFDIAILAKDSLSPTDSARDRWLAIASDWRKYQCSILFRTRTQSCQKHGRKETDGWRSATHVQRLRTVLYFYRRGSGVLPRTWLFGAKALQVVPPGQEIGTIGRRRRLSTKCITGHARDLFRMRTTDHRSVRAPGRPSRLLPELLSGPKDQRWRRRPAKLWARPLKKSAWSLGSRSIRLNRGAALANFPA